MLLSVSVDGVLEAVSFAHCESPGILGLFLDCTFQEILFSFFHWRGCPGFRFFSRANLTVPVDGVLEPVPFA